MASPAIDVDDGGNSNTTDGNVCLLRTDLYFPQNPSTIPTSILYLISYGGCTILMFYVYLMYTKGFIEPCGNYSKADC